MKHLMLLTLAASLLAACSPRESGSPPQAQAPAQPVPASASAAMAGAAAASTAPPEAANGIAWVHAAQDAEVDAAFAQARHEQKPLFLYWGAKWCPPCNQVKATLFNRQDFIERSRAFVPVYIDGDSPGAQKLGTRFKVRGYPTMVLFSPAGAELTRLPGEVDAQQYTQVLTLGMSAQRPAKEVLALARRGAPGLSPNDWKLLAFYSWDTDEQQLVPQDQRPALLAQLARHCPPEQADTATRLFLKSLAATDPARVRKPDLAARDRLLQVLRHAEQSHLQMDVLVNYAADLVRALGLPAGAPRQALLDSFDTSLAGLANDSTLSRADRLVAQIARAQLANLDTPKDAPRQVPPALLSDVREQVARADREITDGYERQAVITTAADLLEEAGVPEESDALLKANLAKSHSPYYLMLGLAGNAKKRGDNTEALRWYEEAFNTSEGPATRLQWGASYLAALVDLAPQDEARIERAAQQLFDEAAKQPNVFYERNARSLQKAGGKLLAWQKAPGHAEVMKRLRAQLDTLCRTQPEAEGQRKSCDSLLSPAKRSAGTA